MDRIAGRARLEWWANEATCLERYAVDITVTADAAGTWWATGRHAETLDAPQREGWDFLMEMDPYFSLALPGEEKPSLFVRVSEAQDGTLTLTEAPDGEDGSVDITFDLP
ncbi:hypothetical protein ACFRJ1_23550 [Streptomyces sp. NPDC056773]|uniref:hypothetical protein n=1 Tax=unclassified Streptomyces TaxID=2593676 RepID=UPI003697278F